MDNDLVMLKFRPIVTCCDPRVVPERLLGLNIGEVFVFRTIGGHPQAVFKDVVTLDIVSQGFEDLVVMYHTGQLICFVQR